MKRQHLALTAAAIATVLAMGTATAKTLVYCSEGSPENFYPGINTTGTSFDANSQIYSRLVDFEAGGTKVVPGLAERWSVSPDGKEYTFFLRKGVKWHSNKNFKPTRDMNADDVLFSVNRLMDPKSPWRAVAKNGFIAWASYGPGEVVKSVDKIDDLTVRFTLKQPAAPFINNLAQYNVA